jgi:hypothetical protein
LLQEWTKCFQTAREILGSHFGQLIIKKIIESLPEYDASNEKSIKLCEENTFESFLAFVYLKNADSAKYGSLLMGLNTQQ